MTALITQQEIPTETCSRKGLISPLSQEIPCSISSDLQCVITQIKVQGVRLCARVRRPTGGTGNTLSDMMDVCNRMPEVPFKKILLTYRYCNSQALLACQQQAHPHSRQCPCTIIEPNM